MNKKVLFIVHDLYQDFNFIPFGVSYLAGFLHKKGVDVQVYSQDVYHYSNKELAEFLDSNEFDLICLGFLAARFKETVLPLCHVINKHKKTAWLILGGHGASPIPEYMLRKTKADIICIGEGEETLYEILQCKRTNRNIYQIEGIAYLDNTGSFFVTKRRAPIKDLDSLPLPLWELFPMDIYTRCLDYPNMDKDEKFSAIVTSRGCTDRCNFCYRLEKGIRVRSVPNVVDEIEILYHKYGVTYLEMFDELFVFSKNRIKDFGIELNKRGLKIKYFCNARVNFIDEEMLDLLKSSGCVFLNFGLESANQNVLNLMNKRATIEQNENAVNLTSKYGIGVGLNFLWGGKGDNEETLRRNVDFLKAHNTYKQVRTIRPVTPYPGCDLYNEAIEKGLLSGPEDFFDRFKNSDLLTVNFTEIADDEFYRLLFKANSELIIDHFKHENNDMDNAKHLIEQFYNLYFKKDYKFRGARVYNKADKQEGK